MSREKARRFRSTSLFTSSQAEADSQCISTVRSVVEPGPPVADGEADRAHAEHARERLFPLAAQLGAELPLELVAHGRRAGAP